MNRNRVTLILMLAGLTTSCASAAPVHWTVADGGNGHWYEAFQGPLLSSGVHGVITWADAMLNAEAEGGYLATITSAEENEFVFHLVDTPEFWGTDGLAGYFGPWLGGWQEPDAADPAANWLWVTGEPFDYTNWHPGEPNDMFGNQEEDRLLFFAAEGLTGPRSAFWNDERGGRRVAVAYVVEYVPEPASALLLTLALVTGLPIRLDTMRARLCSRFYRTQSASSRLVL